jgi:hypothetical protein
MIIESLSAARHQSRHRGARSFCPVGFLIKKSSSSIGYEKGKK